MNYNEAEKIRKQGFINTLIDSIQESNTVGGGLSRGISESFGATVKGIGSKFDPLNIAKLFTGKLGATIAGKLMGRSEDDISYFTGRKNKRNSFSPSNKKQRLDSANYTNLSEGQQKSLKRGDGVADIVAKLYNFLKKAEYQKTKQYELDRNFAKEKYDEAERERKKNLKISKSKKIITEDTSSGNILDTLIKFFKKASIVLIAATFLTKSQEVKASIDKTKKTADDAFDSVKNILNFFGLKIPQKMGGVSGGSTYKEMVAGHESGAAGYDAIYGYSGSGGDPSIAKSHGGKNLSELSIREALKIGDSRMDRNAGALGKYQFLPNTLREMLPLAGLTENDPFNPENQEKLMDALIKYNSSLLQSKGIEPTDVNLGLAHYVGVGGAIKLLKAEEKTPNVSAADILQLSKKGKKTNPELEKPVGEFLANLRKHYTPSTTSQAKVNTTPPKINGNQTKVDTPTPKINANKLNENSKENISLNTPSSGAVIIMDQTTVNNINGVNKPPQVLSVGPKDDRPLTLRAE